jgi:uncharacterized membrane protein YcaP (DUF421 family)
MIGFGELWDGLLGVGEKAEELAAGQMFARACLMYIATLAVVRLGKKRFMAQATAFDVIVGIVIGSIVSRAITGNAPMLPALAATVGIMVMHWLFSAIALRWSGFGTLIKGQDTVVVRNGQVDRQAMRSSHMTDADLQEDLRQQSVDDVSKVAEARVERNGSLSVIKAPKDIQILNIDVADGVQTVRIQVG